MWHCINSFSGIGPKVICALHGHENSIKAVKGVVFCNSIGSVFDSCFVGEPQSGEHA